MVGCYNKILKIWNSLGNQAVCEGWKSFEKHDRKSEISLNRLLLVEIWTQGNEEYVTGNKESLNLNFMYKSNTISIKIPANLLAEIEKLLLKFTGKFEGT